MDDEHWKILSEELLLIMEEANQNKILNTLKADVKQLDAECESIVEKSHSDVQRLEKLEEMKEELNITQVHEETTVRWNVAKSKLAAADKRAQEMRKQLLKYFFL